MYKFIVEEAGCCDDGYDVKKCESHCNTMEAQGYELVQAYQTSVNQCCGNSKSSLVMIFKLSNSSDSASGE